MWNTPLNIKQSGIDASVNDEAKRLIEEIVDERFGP